MRPVLQGLRRVNFGSIASFCRAANMDFDAKPIEKSIYTKISEQLNPSYLEVINESYMHNVPKGSETHFKVVVVSEKFAGLIPIKRHRMVNSLLQTELEGPVHALSIVAKTSEQWNKSSQTVEKSPACKGGFGL